MTDMPDDPVVPLDPDRLAKIVGIADADRRDRGLPPWRNEYGKDVLALVATAREAIALRAEVERLRGQVADWHRVLADFVLDCGGDVQRRAWDAIDRYHATDGGPDEG